MSFGYSSEDIEEALKDIEDIENELLAEIHGVDINDVEEFLSLQKHVVCPLCQVDRMELGKVGMVRCRGRQCGLALVCVEGLDKIQEDLDMVVEKHGDNCNKEVQFSQGENCLLVICSECDFCQTLGGF